MTFNLFLPLLFVVASVGTAVANNDTSPPAPTQNPKPKTSAPITLPPATTTPPTSAPPVNCSSLTECTDCTKSYKCFWCDSSPKGSKCQHFPSGRLVPKDCKKNDWYWKQCLIPGFVLIIVVPVVVGLFLLCCGCCIYCKCCRGSNKGWKKEEERLNAKRQDREMKAAERKSERKKTTDQLRMKYGLLKSDDEEQLIT
jgi:hypothetical protein